MEGKKVGQRQPGAAVLVGRSWKRLEDRCLCVGAHIVGAPVYSIPGHRVLKQCRPLRQAGPPRACPLRD